jgi:Bacterial Ig domain
MKFFLGRLGLILILVLPGVAAAARLTGTFTASPVGTNINLSAAGSLDWVHWGPFTEFAYDRKAEVTPLISDFAIIGNFGFGPYQRSDLGSGFSWNDGLQNSFVTNTTTAAFGYGKIGFTFNVSAGTATNVLRVYVAAGGASGPPKNIGTLSASLSDGSAPSFTASTQTNMEGCYTLTFAAGSANQTLTVNWVGEINDSVISLQSAALASLTSNNPPTAMLLSPSLSATFSTGSTQMLEAVASDSDGAISLVEFFSGADKIGESTSAPYTTLWTNPPVGVHLLKVKATDNLGATYASKSVTVFAWTNGGSLSGSFDIPPAFVDLSSEGTNDWVHWGLLTAESLNRKNGVTPQIENFTKIGTNVINRFLDGFYTACGWTDGTPIASEGGASAGVYIFGLTNGYSLTVPAGRQSRQLKIYTGLYAARASFQAYLSDASAPAYSDDTMVNIYGNAHRVCTLNYSAASDGQSLTIRYTALNSHDTVFGNLTLQAATLSLGPVPLAESIVITNVMKIDYTFSFSFPTDVGAAYEVYRTDSLQPPDWILLTNLVGDGNLPLIMDSDATATNRFYRVFRP